MEEIWLVIGSGMSWGKGEHIGEALRNMFKNDSRVSPSTQINVYKIEGEGLTIKDVVVDDMGGVAWPLTATAKKMVRADVPPALRKAFTAFDEEVEEFSSTTAFYAAFDD
jgi:hypothetical protein